MNKIILIALTNSRKKMSFDPVVPGSTCHVLNEVLRGQNSSLLSMDLCIDDTYATRFRLRTLSAGDSLLAPSVPAICLTPICSHTLSFRPIVVPDTSKIRIMVPHDARNPPCVSFDGRNRMELQRVC